MIIKLFAGKCQDTMADDTYPTIVEIIDGDKSRFGCGKDLF